jgi:ribosomal protein L10
LQVNADNVGSKQMQQIRISLRGHAIVLMGKNTMMRKAIRGHLSNNPKLEQVQNRFPRTIAQSFSPFCHEMGDKFVAQIQLGRQACLVKYNINLSPRSN